MSDDAFDTEERKKLIKRASIAGVVVVLLIGALAMFERAQKPAPSEDDAPRASAPGPSMSLGKDTTGPQAGGAITPPTGPEVVPKPEAPAEPERTAQPEQKPADAAKPATEQAVAESTGGKPRLVVGHGETHAGEAPRAEAKPETKLEAKPETKPEAKPEQKAEAKPTREPEAEAAPVRSGYVVQVGVFNNIYNAEDLRKKLADAGIPAQVEARVQVGPFNSRAEAAAAQEKLKTLGMAPGLVVPPKK